MADTFHIHENLCE